MAAQYLRDQDYVGSVMFPAPPPTYTPDTFSELVWLGTAKSVPALFLPVSSSGGAAPCAAVIFLHGNGQDIGTVYELAAGLRDSLRAHVLAVEYEGYGLCGGPSTPSESGCYRSAEAGYRFLTEDLRLPPGRVVAYGLSIGCGSATYLARSLQDRGILLGGVVLHSPFLSIKSLAKTLVGPTLGAFCLNRFNNLERVSGLRVPALFLHGRRDRLIPFQHSVLLHERCTSAVKYLKLVEGADHNDFRFRDIVGPITSFLDLAGLGEDESLRLPHPSTLHARRVRGPVLPPDEGPLGMCCTPAVSGGAVGWLAGWVGRVCKGLVTVTGAAVALVEFDGSERVDQETHPQ